VSDDRYGHERYDATLAHCHTLSLLFDGKSLSLFSSGKLIKSYPAASGVPVSGRNGSSTFDYSAARQKLGSVGPIPHGTYWINPEELWQSALHKPASQRAWGDCRVTIHPFNTTVTHGRSGFFIHGGTVAGSVGSIVLATHLDAFVNDLRTQLGTELKCQIHLAVDYRLL
jgi:hypothetical protein